MYELAISGLFRCVFCIISIAERDESSRVMRGYTISPRKGEHLQWLASGVKGSRNSKMEEWREEKEERGVKAKHQEQVIGGE